MTASVTETLWFDEATYLGDTTTLLNSQSYCYLKTLRQMRPILIRYYYNAFYNKSFSSIMSPEGVYDPYLVNYLNSKISITDSIYRPVQLYPAFQNYENSIWSRLTDVTNRRLTSIQSSYNILTYQVTRWDISITSLVNSNMVGLDNPIKQAIDALPANADLYSNQVGGGFMPGVPGTDLLNPILYVSTTPGYVLSMNFYNGDKTAMTPFEFLVYAVIYDRTVNDIGDFIESYINTYTNLTLDEQYYFIPLYIWLIDVALNTISAPSSFMT
jgi:hypothetical protein